MLEKDIYGKNLSDNFQSAINAGSQYIKPKILIDFLDSRHAFNKNITVNDPHPSEAPGDFGYYFAPIQLINGNERQSYTWAVADALDQNGKVIKADGNWYAMPSNRADDLEFGWCSNSKSTSTLSETYDGYEFTTSPYITITFNPRKCNNIKVCAPEFNGQIDTYRIIVRSPDPEAPNPLIDEIARIEDGQYFFNHYLPESLGHTTIDEIDLEVLTTKHPNDYARINCINILYQVDVSDYVVSYTQDKVRDLHETSLPIAGSSSGSLQIELDNTEKKFNIFGSTSEFGPFMRKDLKVYATSGWKVHDSDEQYVESSLRSQITSLSSNISLVDNTYFPEGGEDNYFIVEVDYDNENREFILCSGKSNNFDLVIAQRGFNNSKVQNHSLGALVRYETFEYPTYSEYYIDEWSSSTSSMITSVSCADWTKYLGERVLTNGFFSEKVTVPEACESLMLLSNFPKAQIDSLNRFDITAKKKGAILHFDFNESSVDRSGNNIIVSEGLRSRFFQIPSSSLSKVKDITADALDRELSQLEKALGETVATSSTFSSNSIDISDPINAIVQFDDQAWSQNIGFIIDEGQQIGSVKDSSLNVFPMRRFISENTYSIGDPVQAGYVVITPSSLGGLGGDYYYVASYTDIVGYEWGGYDSISGATDPGVTGSAIGDGYQNTINIVNALGAGSYAAKACADYTATDYDDEFNLITYDDWFLPSKDELNEMYNNKVYLNFTPGRFWSSTQYFENVENNDIAINLANPDETPSGFSFPSIEGPLVFENFNSVYDGFYIPLESGEQYLVAQIANGGVRIFLEETLILDQWRNNSVDNVSYFTIESEELDLIAGNPYRLRIETYHQTGPFRFRLDKTIGVSAPVPVTVNETRTVAVIDRIGVRDADFTPAALDRNKQGNTAVYCEYPEIGISGGILSNSENKYCNLVSDSYIRIPYHQSLNIVDDTSSSYINGDFVFEIYAKFPATYSGDGEYLSNYSSASPAAGFEFFRTSSSNGFKLITDDEEVIVSTTESLNSTDFYHIVVRLESGTLSYFVNGEMKDSAAVESEVLSWEDLDITIGGRGASYLEETGEQAPAATRLLMIDEFLIYNKSLSDKEIADRYTECVMKELTIYPFLYGGELTIREIIDEISLADLGRFYIDENNVAKYEHYYKFWEESISQHSEVQLEIDDEDSIVTADYVVQLQANKVVVKVSGISSNLTGVQPLWRADDPTTLAVVSLNSNITSSSDSIFVSSTNDPPFSQAGYLIIDNEIIKYNGKTSNQFLSLERGQFGTEPASHNTTSNVREVRYWDLKFDKAPAYQIRSPFITGIRFEVPNEISILRYVPYPYGAELVIGASTNVLPGSIVFAEGVNPLTDKVAYTAISGIPVLISEQNSQVKEQTATIEACICIYGIKEVVIENKFITDFVHAQNIANFIIEKNFLPVPVLNLQTNPTPTLQLGDRIKISELDAFDIINGEYWVVAKNYNYSEAPSQSLTLRKVS